MRRKHSRWKGMCWSGVYWSGVYSSGIASLMALCLMASCFFAAPSAAEGSSAEGSSAEETPVEEESVEEASAPESPVWASVNVKPGADGKARPPANAKARPTVKARTTAKARPRVDDKTRILALQQTQQILQTEMSRYAAMMNNDLSTLSALLGDELVYVHSTGATENKELFLKSLREGRVRYQRIAAHRSQVRLLGRVAIVTGKGDFEILAGVPHDQREIKTTLVFTAVYMARGPEKARNWQLVSWHSCAPPTPPTASAPESNTQ